MNRYATELEREFAGAVFLTSKQLREVDRQAIEKLRIPGLILMENAGLHATSVALDMLPTTNASAVVLCGAGNNAGDGYVIARQLHLSGVRVQVLCNVPIDKLKGDALVQAQVAKNLGLEVLPMHLEDHSWSTFDLVIDALLGTGFKKPLREDLEEVLRGINRLCERHSLPILAIDLPSGLNADTGESSPATIRATQTVTFVAAKAGFACPSSLSFTGHVHVVPIGIPPGFVAETLRAQNN